MKYMSFNRSCSYTCLAYVVEDYGLEYSDMEIAVEMKLAYLFYYDSENNEYLSGAMLQGKRWFNLFLNRHSLEFKENSYSKNEAINYINASTRKLMIGLNLKTGKHAMVYCPSNTKKYKFFNPHYEKDGSADFFVLSVTELPDLLDDVVTVGYINHDPNIEPPELEPYEYSSGYLDKYLVDIIDFCSVEHTLAEILEVMESLFAGLLLSPIPLLEFEKEDELVGSLKMLQSNFINALRQTSKTIKLKDYLNPLELNKCVRKYKELVKKV